MKDFTEIGLTIIEQAKALIIKDEQDYIISESLGKVISEEIKKIKAYFKPMKADANKAWKNIVNAEKESLVAPEKAKTILKTSMLVYEAKQEKTRQAEEKRLRDELIAKQEKAEEDGLEIEPSEIVAEDIIIAPTFQKQGQTRTVKELVVTDIRAFLIDIAKTADNPEDFISIKTAGVMNQLKIGSTIKGVRLEEKKIKVF